MTTTQAPAARDGAPQPIEMGTVQGAVSDGLAIARRNVIKIKRVPDLLVFTLLSPIMFILLFAYVFGSAIDIPGINYREFLIGGIFAQTVIFGATITGAGLAEDVQKGIMDRFRSLPMSRAAVLFGRTASDVIINVITLVIMSLTGLLVGWRIRDGIGKALLGFLLILAFAYSVSWVMAFIGLLVPSPEVVNNASFLFIFPATFIANTFVPTDNFPSVLKFIADWNPVSAVTQAGRNAFGNVGPPIRDVWSLQNPVLYTLLWIAIILAIFIPLSVRQFKKAASR